jgi:hypothetical protein
MPSNVHQLPYIAMTVQFKPVPIRAFVKVRGQDRFIDNPKIANPENCIRMIVEFKGSLSGAIEIPLVDWSQKLETALRRRFGHRPDMSELAADFAAKLAPIVAQYRTATDGGEG